MSHYSDFQENIRSAMRSAGEQEQRGTLSQPQSSHPSRNTLSTLVVPACICNHTLFSPHSSPEPRFFPFDAGIGFLFHDFNRIENGVKRRETSTGSEVTRECHRSRCATKLSSCHLETDAMGKKCLSLLTGSAPTASFFVCMLM